MRQTALNIILVAAACAMLPSCEKDDSTFSDYDFSKYSLRSVQGDDDDAETLSDTIALNIRWNGDYAYTEGETGDSVTIVTGAKGSDVIVTATTQRFLQITVSGTSTDGSLLVYGERKWALVLNGLTLNNPDGPAINNQCGKALYVTLADDTENTITDGSTYAEAEIDQKGAFFSEGQLYLRGNGTLSVTGNCKNAIASDDYIVVGDDSQPSAVSAGPVVNVQAKGTNGIKANDGMEIAGGLLTINVESNGGRGIKSDAYVAISGGQTTITTTGDCLEETLDDGTTDYASCAGIKSDSLFTMTAGQLTITSTGDGGKGINCAQNVEMSGGTLVVTTTGTNYVAKPKGVKSDTGIIVSGGSFSVSVDKSWACDNGTDSDDPAERVTIVGSPSATPILEKKNVVITYD